jgi:hypothetical protein
VNGFDALSKSAQCTHGSQAGGWVARAQMLDV